jgi:hypothetical protein
MRTITRLLLFFVSFLAMQKSSMAQPFTLDEIQPQELVLRDYKKDDPKAKGKISTTAITQDKDTMYFWVQGLSMYSPTFFNITTSDPQASLKVNLCKENWKQPHQTGDIKGKGKWNTNFKTESDFGIMVIAGKKPVKYALLVWTGNEVKVDIPSPFKGGTGESGGGGWIKKNMILIIVAIAAVLIIGFLLFKLKKNKK